jgi:hypothetical protein
MKITKNELRNMIKDSVDKYKNQYFLQKRLEEVRDELNQLNEDDSFAQSNEEVQEIEPQSKESIFDSKPGETIIMNFDGVTIKLERQLDDLFKVVDAAESKKLSDGDYVKIQGNDSLEQGKNYKFVIYRETPLKYETNPLQSWKIIKN